MTHPLAERDPTPEREWHEASSPGMRRYVLQQTAAAVRRAREKRTTVNPPAEAEGAQA